MKLNQLPVVVIFALAAATANADGLRGVKDVRLIVEQLDEDARACGLTPDGVDAGARLVLSNSRLNITTAPGAPYYYVNVTVLRSGGSCVGTLSTQFRRAVWADSGTGKADDLVVAAVWEKTQMLSTAQMNFSTRINQQTELLTKQFVAAWLKEN